MTHAPEKLFERSSRHLRERNRYMRERDDLLAALFQPYETRKHLAEAILAGDPDALSQSSSERLHSRQGQ